MRIPIRRAGQPLAAMALAAIALALAPRPAAIAGPAAERAVTRIDPAAIVSVIDRADIEMSGLTRLTELLFDRSPFNAFGTFRPAVAGPAEVAYLLDGRHLTGWDPDTVPLSAIERVEILEPGTARHAGSAVGGVVNVVSRSRFRGWEVAGTAGFPASAGGDTRRASAVWGGAAGAGRLLIGVDHAGHQEVRDRDRPWSRARWTPGGSIAGTRGVSTGGNTLVYVPAGQTTAVYAPLGACDPAIYTGALDHPSGQVCGYPFADVKWQGEDSATGYANRSRNGVFVSGGWPVRERGEVYWDARLSDRTTRFRYAPSTGIFDLTVPEGALRNRLIDATEGLTAANFPASGRLDLSHRFVGHGNRDWRGELTEYDVTLGARGEAWSDVGYDLHLRGYRSDLTETGATFVSEGDIRNLILAGDYDVLDPLSADPAHLAAVRASSLWLTQDTVSEHRTARLTLDGFAFPLPGGPVRWLAGVEANDQKWLDRYAYRDAEGDLHDPADAIGSAGNSSAGDRLRTSALGEVTLPVLARWDVTLSGRASEYDDVGSAFAWAMRHRLEVTDGIALRASWERGANPPSLSDLHLTRSISFPRITYGTPAVTEQIEMATGGNPDLAPNETERFGLGARVGAGPVSVSADWFSIAIREDPAILDPQAVVDLHLAGNGPAGTEVVRTGQQIDRIVNPIVQGGEEDVRGIALGAEAAWKAGPAEIGLELHWVRVTSHETRALGRIEPGDRPRDRVHGQLRLGRGAVSVRWNVHSVSGYRNVRGTGRFDRWTGHDVAVAWRDALPGADLVAGVLNAGDRGPAIDSSGESNPALTVDSVRGRTFFATLSWSF